MTDYSELAAYFLMVPVVVQIIIPLLMLAVFCLVHGARSLFGRHKAPDGLKRNIKVGEELSLSGI